MALFNVDCVYSIPLVNYCVLFHKIDVRVYVMATQLCLASSVCQSNVQYSTMNRI